MVRVGRHWAALGMACVLSGCGRAPKLGGPTVASTGPTIVNVNVQAGPDLNPGTDGAANPTVLRIYQLGSSSGFTNAEFFPVYNADTATLGPDLIRRDDVPLNPGGTKTMTLNPAETVHAVGFFAGLRDFQAETWRASADIPPHQTTNVTVTLNKAGIAVQTQTVPAGRKS